MKYLKISVSLLAFISLCGASAAGMAQTQQTQTSAEEEPQADTQLDAPTQPPVPCQAAEFRQMDFWVGDWDLTWLTPNGATKSGKNTVTRSAFGDCVITENFDGAPGNTLKGMSVSTYSKPHGQWRQSWVDNQGGYFSLHGGLQPDDSFILEMDRLNNKGPYSRMVFEDIKADSLVWRWQGKTKDEDKWADQWVIQYKRRL